MGGSIQRFPAVIYGRSLAGYALDYETTQDIRICVYLRYKRFTPGSAPLRLCVFAFYSESVDAVRVLTAFRAAR